MRSEKTTRSRTAFGISLEKSIRFILSTGSDYTKCPNCPLSKAAMRGDINIIRMLIESHDRELEQRGIDALLHALSRPSHLDVVRLLLERGADQPCALSSQSDPTHTNNLALECAIKFVKPNALELLLADSRVDPTYDNCAVLHFASELISWSRELILPILMRDERIRTWSTHR